MAEFPSSSTAVAWLRRPGGAMQSFRSVVDVAVLTVTEQLPVGARSPKLQLSTWVPIGPDTVQAGAAPLWPLQVTVGLAGPQLRLEFGSGSWSAGSKCTLW